MLEYTIDTLLKTFNYQRKFIMKKVHFYKMMDILDTRLQKQGIDIGYPKYWYRYGSVADVGVLSQRISVGFSPYLDGDFILPYPYTKSYDVDVNIKSKINSTVSHICKQYQYKENYGQLLKEESYRLNSPYKFNTIFQDLLDSVKSLNNSRQTTLYTETEIIEPLLDCLSAEFPEENYPELLDMYLAWDDTARLILHHVKSSGSKHIYLDKITEIFWITYSNAIKIDYNQHIPKENIKAWEEEYLKSIAPSLIEIEAIRKKIILDNDFDIIPDDGLVKETLEIAYYNL